MPATRHTSIEPAHPGALVAEAIEALDFSKAEAARRLGITRSALYAVLDQRAAISAAMAVRIERVTGASAGLLVRIQAEHDLWHARKKLRKIA